MLIIYKLKFSLIVFEIKGDIFWQNTGVKNIFVSQMPDFIKNFCEKKDDFFILKLDVKMGADSIKVLDLSSKSTRKCGCSFDMLSIMEAFIFLISSICISF
ncbi:hypothetical protein PPERSA_10789 [Pseudocohnilembus persalinus]|uniref:Uncharacterized protein n=1 Tax=Pseudocohnilembus persalinus TaxID=266149 RepID=A0A0V0QDM7_PSEPJ|nr:hypothetical protein PPERSA_10789 [Pseudocohnilembus persalinus]|eukprot:KRX00290.1 hypothetical protein PPERSA_10789 [Pseudocohnilembus persalinus]